MGCCNNGWGGGGCLWIILLIIILCCCCGGGYGEDLIAVSQHHQKVGTVGGEIISKGAHGRTGGLDHVRFIIPLP